MDASASRRFRDNLTFSSTLLDEIYRSIDEQQSPVCTELTRRKQSNCVGNNSGKSSNCCFNNNDNDRRARLDVNVISAGRSSAADLDRSLFCVNSSPRFCDFSSGRGRGGGFSLSEAQSLYGVPVKPKPKLKSKPKPIRTGDEFTKREKHRDDSQVNNNKREGKFMNTKSKALKIYNDLKKVKQPISPGGRLSTFLNSLFTTGNSKKSHTSTASAGDLTESARNQLHRKSTSQNASTCSISRSCLTNTPSSRGRLINDVKKSVTFYEETDSNRGKFTGNSVNKGVKVNLSDNNNRHVSEAARSLLKNYQKRVESELDSVTNKEDEDSDSSSDLFELNNLSPIRIDRHQEELPLYATTHIHTNRSIVNNNNLFM